MAAVPRTFPPSPRCAAHRPAQTVDGFQSHGSTWSVMQNPRPSCGNQPTTKHGFKNAGLRGPARRMFRLSAFAFSEAVALPLKSPGSSGFPGLHGLGSEKHQTVSQAHRPPLPVLSPVSHTGRTRHLCAACAYSTSCSSVAAKLAPAPASLRTAAQTSTISRYPAAPRPAANPRHLKRLPGYATPLLHSGGGMLQKQLYGSSGAMTAALHNRQTSRPSLSRIRCRTNLRCAAQRSFNIRGTVQT